MEKSKTGFRFLFFCAILFFTLTFYNCGGGDEDSSTNSFTKLSKINGRIMDVIVHNNQPNKSIYAKLLKFIEVVKTANAQGFSTAGITVIALQLVAGEEIYVDEDITDGAGGFSLDVPAAEIILQFIIGDDFFESTLNVPKETTIEIFVNINAGDPLNPVEVSEMEMIDQVEGDDDDDNQGSEGAIPPGDDDDDSGQGNGIITSSAMLLSINSMRVQGANCGSEGTFGPQLPLAINSALGQAALRHSNDMASLDFFGHTGSDGTTPITRMSQAGFNGNAWGENILKSTNQMTAEQVVAGWMASGGHCANIMAEVFTQMGSASASSASWEYWTLDLGN